MNGQRNLRLTLALAVASASGIIGMLLLEGAADLLALMLAALPLVIGAVRLQSTTRERQTHRVD